MNDSPVVKLVERVSLSRSTWNAWGPAMVTLVVTTTIIVVGASVVTGTYLAKLDGLIEQVGKLDGRVGKVEERTRDTQDSVNEINYKLDNVRGDLTRERQDRLDSEARSRSDNHQYPAPRQR